MRADLPQTIRLKDYKPTPYIVERVQFDVHLHDTATKVLSQIKLRPRGKKPVPLVFQGEELELQDVKIDGKVLPSKSYKVSSTTLTIARPPQKPFTLEISQSCNPKANTKLSGLYLSNNMFCTQMEAEGFRRFAYFYDRPDVMAKYRVRIEAPQSLPVLLSNGNLSSKGKIKGTDRHFAVWDDPHPKPSYLFALVGGDLASVQSSFTTSKGKRVKLGIYVEKGKEDRCAWAMTSLKASMKWDEKRFGRAYDLSVFNIVAVSDFNMGAMENKGLNIFNDKYILARPDTATDMDYMLIEAIIGHEYFHNWTGNRITCRDWFQLCLKEGLTVFRDQEFTSDIRSRAVKRIQDVRTLRARQFPEDQGPLSHPPRPNAYIEINNFYTPTVYEKGAEICRMLLTLIGAQKFRKAMDLYFKTHDGEAATVEDFVAVMAKASGRDLKQFFRWYEQAGTPVVQVKTKHDAARKTYSLTVSQHSKPTPGQPKKAPYHMPLNVALVDAKGNDVASSILELRKASETFVFKNVAAQPVLSFNRGFSAPIVAQTDQTIEDLLFLMGHDADSFSRWEAAQNLGRGLVMETVKAMRDTRQLPHTKPFAEALLQTLNNRKLDDAFKSLMLTLPPEAEIAASLGGDADSDLVMRARDHVRHEIAVVMREALEKVIAMSNPRGVYKPDPKGVGQRSLRYAALSLLAAADGDAALSIAERELQKPFSMSSEIGALTAILGVNGKRRDEMLDQFYARHHDDHLIVDKWFMMGAQVPGNASAARIEKLLQHPAFKLTTPNRVYALIGGFTGGNLSGFNAASGEGYRVVADTIIALNAINPQVAARMATGFRSWRLFDSQRRAMAERELQRILATPELSRDVFEIISKTLKG